MKTKIKDVSAKPPKRSIMAWKTKDKKRVCTRVAQKVCVLLAALLVSGAILSSEPSQCAPEVAKMVVAAKKLNVFGDDSLSGTPIKSYVCGETISVSKYSDGVFSVLSGGSVIGYCSPVDLVGEDSIVYTYVPYKLGVDASGATLVSDLVDLDYYIYENDSLLTAAGEGKLLLQRETLEKLEDAAELLGAKYSLRITSAYTPSSSDPGYGIPSNTGALITISVRQGDIEWSLADMPQIASIMASAGFSIVDAEACVFCDDAYTSYLGVDLDLSDLPIFVLRG